jgi:hypothetical protein
MMQQLKRKSLGFIIIIRPRVLEMSRVLAKRNGERQVTPEFSERQRKKKSNSKFGALQPHGKERHHTSVSPDPHRRTPDPYIHISLEPPGRSALQQGPRTRRTLVCAGVQC